MGGRAISAEPDRPSLFSFARSSTQKSIRLATKPPATILRKVLVITKPLSPRWARGEHVPPTVLQAPPYLHRSPQHGLCFQGEAGYALAFDAALADRFDVVERHVGATGASLRSFPAEDCLPFGGGPACVLGVRFSL